MKQATKLVLALALIVAGILWILNITGVFNIAFSTRGWLERNSTTLFVL